MFLDVFCFVFVFGVVWCCCWFMVCLVKKLLRCECVSVNVFCFVCVFVCGVVLLFYVAFCSKCLFCGCL